MSYKMNKNPVEIAFYYWAHNFPASNHPCDEERFHTFVKTAFHYSKEGRKWLHNEFFVSKCAEHCPFLQTEIVEKYFERFEILHEFLFRDSRVIRKKEYVRDGECFKYRAVSYKDGKLHFADIDQDYYKTKREPVWSLFK